MFGMIATTTDETANVAKAVDKASYKSFGHAGASIRKEAIASIEKATEPSPAGSPPTTRRGLLRRAIRYAVEPGNESVVIGPRFSVIGTAGEPHEHGDQYKGGDYPARPFMGPALEKNLGRLAASWEGAVGR